MPTNILINASSAQIAQINLAAFGALSNDQLISALAVVLAGITSAQAALLNNVTICSNVSYVGRKR
jgi:hypothetical protein